MRAVEWTEGWRFSSDGGPWQAVTLPHDAMLTQGRAADAPSGSGGAYFRSGLYRYEKRFPAPESWREQTVLLEIDGAYPHAELRLNGKPLGLCAYGYGAYRFALDELLLPEDNLLEIAVDHRDTPDSRWYSGAGLYRPVRLWIGGKTHIEPYGLRVKTLSIDPATVEVTVNIDGDKTDLEILTEILWDGVPVASGEGDRVVLNISDAALWSAETPNLYLCRCTLRRGRQVLDRAETPFGIRVIRWSTDGLFVNGRETKLRGGCLHHDNGVLGAKEYRESAFRKVQILKEHGFNAIRSAHNPASRDLLDACDTLGMYVMDETWDMWYKHKTKYDYASRFQENWRADIRALVEKDFNHPGVLLYSIGNELTEPKDERGVLLAKELVAAFHAEDSSRPVTAGINLTLILMAQMGIDLTLPAGAQGADRPQEVSSKDFNEMMATRGQAMELAAARPDADVISSPVLDALDIAGYNYASARYKLESEKHPQRIIVGSETYPHRLAENWSLVEKLPYVIGDFMWTAWDYLGEAGIGHWSYALDDNAVPFNKPYPHLLGDTGAIDILGRC